MRRSQRGIARQSARLLALIALIHLAGCSRTVQSSADLVNLPTQVDGASDAGIISLQARLSKAAINVISLGQDYLVVIPSGLLFATQSPRLTWESYQVLNEVVCYLQQFRKVSVNVRAFSSKYVSKEREHALTLARAEAVAEYLWSQGIDSRFIFTQGAGSDKPIVAFKTRGDLSPNSRIEISFRRAIV